MAVLAADLGLSPKKLDSVSWKETWTVFVRPVIVAPVAVPAKLCVVVLLPIVMYLQRAFSLHKQERQLTE